MDRSEASVELSPVPLRIESEMSIYQAWELKQRILAAIEARPDLDLDLAAVGEFDTAGLQLLLLARREAEQRGGRLRVLQASEAVTGILGRCGLDPVSLVPAGWADEGTAP